MKILAMSDLHGSLPQAFPQQGFDVLAIAGDICPVDHSHTSLEQKVWVEGKFQSWIDFVLREGVAKRVVLVAGNHDFVFASYPKTGHSLKGADYLYDGQVEIEGVVFHGSPWVPKFGDWAFMADLPTLRRKATLMPVNTDVLISHGPPHGTLDLVGSHTHTGNYAWYDRLVEDRPVPEVMIFGHIHEQHGYTMLRKTHCFNVSVMDDNYEVVYPTTEIEI